LSSSVDGVPPINRKAILNSSGRNAIHRNDDELDLIGN
jgi:hypothetical protein